MQIQNRTIQKHVVYTKHLHNVREDTHKKFIVSQKPVLDRWQKILSIYKENPLSLEEYFTKGIALALHQKEFNLSKEELYDKFNLN